MTTAAKTVRADDPFTPKANLTRPAKAWIMLTRANGKPLWVDYYMISAVDSRDSVTSGKGTSCVYIYFSSDMIALYGSDAEQFLRAYEGFVGQFNPIAEREEKPIPTHDIGGEAGGA